MLQAASVDFYYFRALFAKIAVSYRVFKFLVEEFVELVGGSRMTVKQIESLRAALSEFLGEFANCFGRFEPRGSQ